MNHEKVLKFQRCQQFLKCLIFFSFTESTQSKKGKNQDMKNWLLHDLIPLYQIISEIYWRKLTWKFEDFARMAFELSNQQIILNTNIMQ